MEIDELMEVKEIKEIYIQFVLSFNYDVDKARS